MEKINSDLIRGNIDTIILKTMENGDMYGLDIIREVENKSNGTYELKQPTLYSCLKRLENQELISSYWLDSDIGGKRHYYKLTDKGQEIIKSKQEEWSKSKLLIDNLLGDFNYDEYRLVKKDDYEKIINGKPVIQYVTIPETSTQDTNNDLNNKDNEIINDAETIETEEQLQEPETKIDDNTSENEIYQEVSTDISNITVEDNRPAPFDNELIFFKPKQENPTEIKEEPKKVNFEQTSAFLNKNLFNDFELTKEIKEYNKPKDIIQQDLFNDIVMPYQNKVDSVINEFSDNISKLNNFDYSGENKQEEVKSEDLTETENVTKTNEDTKISQTIDTQDDSYDDKSCFIQDNAIDFLSELSELNSPNETNFKIDDGYETPTQTNEQPNYENQHIENSNQNSTLDDVESLLFDNISSGSLTQNLNDTQNTISYSEEKNNESKINYTIDYNLEEERNYESLFAPKEDLDDIIYRNASAYSYENPKDDYYSSLSSIYNSVNENEHEEYKQKVQDLTEYSKNTIVMQDNLSTAKDIQTLKDEYKNEGIVVKEFNKTSSFTSSKNYVMINKLNLIKSLILLFGYVFVLSAMFIIMDSTSLKNMEGFSFNYFLVAFVPFIVYFLYYLVQYLFNPYKKVPAKRSSRVMLFISLVISIQLLLITYCVNLQFGFYSFYQANYNHLLWIVPTVVSFAPIISTIIFNLLYRSKNFNI